QTPLASPTGSNKTTLALDPKGGTAGLLDLLAVLQGLQVRLLSLQVRPIAAQPWRQAFFVELRGHAQESPLSLALQRLEERAGAMQWMGSYPARVALLG